MVMILAEARSSNNSETSRRQVNAQDDVKRERVEGAERAERRREGETREDHKSTRYSYSAGIRHSGLRTLGPTRDAPFINVGTPLGTNLRDISFRVLTSFP